MKNQTIVVIALIDVAQHKETFFMVNSDISIEADVQNGNVLIVSYKMLRGIYSKRTQGVCSVLNYLNCDLLTAEPR